MKIAVNRRSVFIAAYAFAIVTLVVGYAYKHADESMAACVSECLAKCAR